MRNDPVKSRKITMLPCGKKYRHEIGEWSGEYPLSQLDKWINFYKIMAKDYPSGTYQHDAKALLIFKKLEVDA